MPEGTENPLILIVDDNPANLDLLAQVLRASRYHVRAVPSGRLALESARISPPELILLDIKMPEQDGYQVCRILKADEALREIPVIFISALDDAWDKVKAFQVGGADYLTKPFQTEEVLARVGYQVQLRRAQRQLVEYTRSLELANLKLLEVDKLKQGLTAMLVHDLRSPLQGIALILDLYREEQQIPASMLQAAERSIQDMSALMNDLMEVFRGAGAELPVTFESVDLCEIIRQICNANLPVAASQKIRLDLELPSDLPAVQADQRLLARALGNLLGNAIKYTSPGGRVLVTAEEISGTGLEQGLRWVALHVKDSGRGIPPEEIPFIFDPFHQVMATDASLGFGLGLTIVQRIMAAHKGRATVQSQLGIGTVFTLLFPLRGGLES